MADRATALFRQRPQGRFHGHIASYRPQVTFPSGSVRDPGVQVSLAETRVDMSEPPERRAQRCCHPLALGRCDRCLVEVANDVLDESLAPCKELTPVPHVGRVERMALVQYPEDAFGHHIAKFLHPGTVRVAEWLIRALLHRASHGKRLDALPGIQHVEPVFVVYLREKRPVTAGVDSQRSAANEGLLASAYHAECMTDN